MSRRELLFGYGQGRLKADSRGAGMSGGIEGYGL